MENDASNLLLTSKGAESLKAVYQTDSTQNFKIKGETKWNKIKKALSRDKYLWMLVLPGIIYYIIFSYTPMYGLVIAFKDFLPFKGIWDSPWVGFKWFEQFFDTYYFGRILTNTLLISLYSIVWGFPAPIIFALLLNEVQHKKFKRVSQTVSYLPHFISTVVIVGIVVNFLSPSAGIINNVIRALGGESINFMVEPEWFRTIYITSDIWQGIGWNSIIYLAALSGIDQELYEAATVDGASRLRKMWHITIPGILPTVVILLILRFGSVLNVGYEKIILMYNSQTYETADVIGSYVYRRGIAGGEYSFGTAVGLFQNVVNFMLIITFNRISRKVSEISLW